MKIIKIKIRKSQDSDNVLPNKEMFGYLINQNDRWGGSDQTLLITTFKGKDYVLYEGEYDVINDNLMSNKTINLEITFLKNQISKLTSRLQFITSAKEEIKSLKSKDVDFLTLKLYKILQKEKNITYKTAEKIIGDLK